MGAGAMSDKIKAGGPAFPAVKIISGDHYNPPIKTHYPGMTLRDYFAAAALQGQINNTLPISSDEGRRLIAERAYRLADVMLKERDK